MKKILVLITLVIVSLMAFSVSANALFHYGYYRDDMEESNYYVIDSSDTWYNVAREFVLSEALMLRKDVRVETLDHGAQINYYVDFLGEDKVTRSYVSALLHRYNGNDVTVLTAWEDRCLFNYHFTVFVDIPEKAWYTPAAQWAYENGIINGVGDDCFAPDRTITREEFAAMLYRYTNYLKVDTTARVDYSEFEDSDSVSDWAHDAMSWAVAEGLINGKPGKLLAPQDTITRAEVATVIYRYNNEVKAHRDIWDGN